jgi:hypothetical protein
MSNISIFAMDDITTTVLEVSPNNYVSFSSDGTIRSPRTPTWSPHTPSSPFEYDRFLSASSSPSPSSSERKRSSVPPPPPDAPLPWVWQCHLCRNRYPLGVTRRCLYDGHYYCSGESGQPNLKKKKGRACSSEFDYEGWETYGDWRARALQQRENGRNLRGCEMCKFPSQCRTPPVLFPVTKKEKKKTTTTPTTSTTAAAAMEVAKAEPVLDKDIISPISEECHIVDSPVTDSPILSTPTASANAMVDFDSILKDLMRDEEDFSPTTTASAANSASRSNNDFLSQLKAAAAAAPSPSDPAAPSNTSATSGQRSKSKDRNFSKFTVTAVATVEEEERAREDVAQSLSGLVMPVFEMLSGKGKSGNGKAL